jgi:hypothetical protein
LDGDGNNTCFPKLRRNFVFFLDAAKNFIPVNVILFTFLAAMIAAVLSGA